MVSLAFLPDGDLAAGTERGEIQFWNVSEYKLIGKRRSGRGSINCLACSSDGRFLAAGSEEGPGVDIWRIDARRRPTGRTPLVLPTPGSPPAHFCPVPLGATDAAFQPGRDRIALGSELDAPRFWSAVTGAREHPINNRGFGDARSLAFSPNGHLLVIGSNSGDVTIWDMLSGRLIRLLEGHTSVVNAVQFAPRGPLLATASADGMVIVWDTRSWKERYALAGLSGIPCLAFSPDGRTLAVGCEDGRVRLLNAMTGKMTRTFQAHRGILFSLAFSPDGRYLATGGQDDAARLWMARVSTPAAL